MKVDKDEADYFAECLKDSLRVNLNEKHLTWFNQVSVNCIQSKLFVIIEQSLSPMQ